MNITIDLDQIMNQVISDRHKQLQDYYKTEQSRIDQADEELFCLDCVGIDIPFSFKTEIYNSESKAKAAQKAYNKQRRQMGYSAKQFKYIIKKEWCMADAKVKSHFQYYDLRDKISLEDALPKYYACADAKGGMTSPEEMTYFLIGFGKRHNCYDENEINEIVNREFEL